jgi:uncharacterized protein YndB with AHSA1/START domain
MKQFRTVEVVKAPIEEVWRAIRDRLDDLVPHLDEIRSVTVEHREESPDGTVKLVNLWQAKANIPSVLNSVIKPEYLAWTDRATWNPANFECTWQIEMHFHRERTKCHGSTLFEPALGNRGTRVSFAGEFSMDAKGMKGVPTMLESTLESGVEAFVTSLIPTNFRKLVQVAANVAAKSATAG